MAAPSIAIKLVEAASLLMLGAVLLAVLDDRPRQGWRRNVVVGLCLAVSALASMADPLVWRPGFVLDARAAAIVLSAPFGGPVATIVVVALCTAMRLAIGGAGVPLGLLGIALTGLASLGWWWHLVRRKRPLGLADLHGVALTAALVIGPAALAWPSYTGSFRPSVSGATTLMAINFAGVELLGLVLLWIRQRRRALDDVAASEAQLRAIADNLPGAIYERRLSRDGALQFRFISEGLRQVVGVSAESALADPDLLQGLIAPEDKPRFDAAIAQSAQDLVPFAFDGTVIRPDGRRIAIRSHATPMRDETGDVVWNGLMLDVTEQVRLAREAEEAREAAGRAADAKSRFLAYVTHEFRSPLTAILGYSEFALRSSLLTPGVDGKRTREQAQLADQLETIRRGAEHLAAMTEDLLDLGKTEAGRLTLAPTWLDLAPLVEQTMDLLRPKADQGGVELALVLGPGQRVYADPRRLQQILLNLTANAIKYSRPGGRVVLRAHSTGDEDILEIADTGIGMNAAQVAVAFDAYGQVDNRENRASAGTGLGLPLAKQLVELHGGSIRLTSAEGQGTRVTVSLPRPSGSVHRLAFTAAA